MNRRQIFDAQDPYSQAITSLVKKTLIVLGICILVIGGGAGYFLIKSGLKMSGSKKVVTQNVEASAEVLAAAVKTEATPQVAATILPSASPIATVLPSPSLLPTPTPTAIATPTPAATNIASVAPLPSATPNIQKVTISATAGQDGYIDSKGSVNTSGELRVGSTQGTSVRSFISFNIASLEESKVQRGKLRIYQKGGKNNPFVSGADIRGDLVNYGSSLDQNDYAVSSINPSFIILSNTEAEGWREVDITDSIIKSKKEGRQLLQIRLHLSFENDAKEAYTIFESGNNTLGTNNLPQLSLELK